MLGDSPRECVLYCPWIGVRPAAGSVVVSAEGEGRSFPARAGRSVGGLEYAGTWSDRSVANQVLPRLLCVASGLAEAVSCLGGRCKDGRRRCADSPASDF